MGDLEPLMAVVSPSAPPRRVEGVAARWQSGGATTTYPKPGIANTIRVRFTHILQACLRVGAGLTSYDITHYLFV